MKGIGVVKRLHILLISLTILVVLFIVALPLFIIYRATSQQNIANGSGITHILGGFEIATSTAASRAAAEGVQVVFNYGTPPSENSSVGQRLQSLHMKVIDGYISSYMYYYECHRTAVLKPALLRPGQYCPYDSHPDLTNENVLLATIAAHLKQVQNNRLITGYWVLDDWVKWDAGSARLLLMKIHQLIQRYTPGRPDICGFGGSIGLHQEYGWNDWIADNFSPQGCDAVGLYVYAPSYPDTSPVTASSDYNWSMAGLLSAMFTSLQRRGWNMAQEPLIGIGQAFGGHMVHKKAYWIIPDVKSMVTQSKSFCEHGATSLVFYAWSDSEFGPATQTPMNSAAIATGIRDGTAACRQIWNHQ